jgi:hypothetical protein
MEILEAYDLVGTYRGAAELAGCDHHTVKHYVQRRAAGLPPDADLERPSIIDPYRAKIEELVERSNGKIRADVVHDRLVAMGFEGTDRTTRRAVEQAKDAYAAGRRRVYRPWITEPGVVAVRLGHRPRSRDGRRCCSARGWPGRGSGS